MAPIIYPILDSLSEKFFPMTNEVSYALLTASSGNSPR